MNIEVIQDYVRDKKILLVGNGEHKEDLEGYDVVIRMNYAIEDKPADIWVNNLIQYHRKNWDWEALEFKYMLRLNAENGGNRLTRGMPTRYEDKTYTWNASDYLSFSERVGYTQPFTGTTTLHWLCSNTNPKLIDVVGMNFFFNKNYASTHKPEMDKEYVLKLAEKYPICLK